MYSGTRGGDREWRGTRPRIWGHSEFRSRTLSRWANVSMQENAMFLFSGVASRPSVHSSLRLGPARLSGGAARTDPNQRIHPVWCRELRY